jgi:hypothetical protein
MHRQSGSRRACIVRAAGNLAPIYTVQNDFKTAHIGEFRVLLGDKILAATRELRPAGEGELVRAERWLETARKAGLGWPVDLPSYASKSATGTDLVRIPVRFLRINDTVLWGAPVELFCEIAMRVRNQSPFRYTFYLGYSNGWLGYLPTAQAFREGLRTPHITIHGPGRERLYRGCNRIHRGDAEAVTGHTVLFSALVQGSDQCTGVDTVARGCWRSILQSWRRMD